MRIQTICWMFPLFSFAAEAATIDLGATANGFAVLAWTTVTNTGASSVFGNVGVAPGTSVTGFPPGTVTGGAIHAGDAVSVQAQIELTTAYNAFAGMACDTPLTGQDLGGLTLMPGVYCFATSAQLSGTLTLDGMGDPNALFVFQIGSTLTTATASAVAFSNGGLGSNVFWQVGSSATLGTGTAFAGNILANTSITLTTGTSIQCGRVLARSGAVTMDTNAVSIDPSGCEAATTATPEPSTLALTILLGLPVFGRLRARSSMRTH